jgi:hypothetical protein
LEVGWKPLVWFFIVTGLYQIQIIRAMRTGIPNNPNNPNVYLHNKKQKTKVKYDRQSS